MHYRQSELVIEWKYNISFTFYIVFLIADGYSLVKLRNSSDSAHKIKEQSSPEYSKLTSKDGGNSPGNSPGYYKLTNDGSDTQNSSVPKSKNSNINPKSTPPPLPSDPPPHGRPKSLMLFTKHSETIIQLDELPKAGAITTDTAALRVSMLDPSQPHTATTQFKEDSDIVYSMAGHSSVSLENLTVGGESDAHYSVISRPSSVCTLDDIYDNADKNLEPVDYEDFYSVPNDIDEADDSEIEEEESMADNKTSSGKEEKISKTEENICNVELKIDAGDLGVGTQGTTTHIAEAGPPPRGARFMSKIPPPVTSRRPRSVSNNIELSSNCALETNVRSFRHGLKPTNNNPS